MALYIVRTEHTVVSYFIVEGETQFDALDGDYGKPVRQVRELNSDAYTIGPCASRDEALNTIHSGQHDSPTQTQIGFVSDKDIARCIHCDTETYLTCVICGKPCCSEHGEMFYEEWTCFTENTVAL